MKKCAWCNKCFNNGLGNMCSIECRIKKRESSKKSYMNNPQWQKDKSNERYYVKRREILEKFKVYRNNNRKLLNEWYKQYRIRPDIKKKLQARSRTYFNGVRDSFIFNIGKCEMCSRNNNLELHHVDYNDINNVKLLCRDCHRKLHRKLFGRRLD